MPQPTAEEIGATKKILMGAFKSGTPTDYEGNPIPDEKITAAAKYLHQRPKVDIFKFSEAVGLSVGIVKKLRQAQLDAMKSDAARPTQSRTQAINSFLSQKFL